MSTLIIYMVKVAAWMAGFYSVYFIFLSRDTYYNRNRLYLVFTSVISFILPFVYIKIGADSAMAYFGKSLSEIVVRANGTSGISGGSSFSLFSDITITLTTVYLAGMALLAIKLITDFSMLGFLIFRNRHENSNIIYFNNLNTAGFSAFGYIFLSNDLEKDEQEEIIRHERNHLSHKHSGDIVLMELIRVLQWFNPVVHMTNRSLRAIHEYQADEGCIKEGIPVSRYQSLLLNNILRTRIFITSNSFSNPSLLRKRLVMMRRTKSGESARFKTILALPVAFGMFLLLSAFDTGLKTDKWLNDQGINTASDATVANRSVIKPLSTSNPGDDSQIAPPPPPPPPPSLSGESKSTITDFSDYSNDKMKVVTIDQSVPENVFTVVEEMPVYPGGEKALMDYIYSNVAYPAEALEKKIQGRVILKFVITYDGKVGEISILKSVHPSLDNEAVRVIRSLPLWTPGKQGGKPVNVYYNVPVSFMLK